MPVALRRALGTLTVVATALGATGAPTTWTKDPGASWIRYADSSQGFVHRSGAKLVLDGGDYRFSGANAYWLALNDDGTYPSTAEVDDALATVAEMGGSVVRSWGAMSVGCATC